MVFVDISRLSATVLLVAPCRVLLPNACMLVLVRSLVGALLASGVAGALVRIDDQSPQLDYVGSWTTARASYFSAGSCRWTSQRADKVVYTGSNGAFASMPAWLTFSASNRPRRHHRAKSCGRFGLAGRRNGRTAADQYPRRRHCQRDGMAVSSARSVRLAYCAGASGHTPYVLPNQFIKTGDDDLHFSVDSLLVTMADPDEASIVPPREEASVPAATRPPPVRIQPPASSAQLVQADPTTIVAALSAVTLTRSLLSASGTAPSSIYAPVLLPTRPATPTATSAKSPATATSSLPKLLAIGLGCVCDRFPAALTSTRSVLGTCVFGGLMIWLCWRRIRRRADSSDGLSRTEPAESTSGNLYRPHPGPGRASGGWR